jgi:ABC-2 type transport system permease protein
MNKTFTIAKREYQALVRTKAFIISLLVMPLFALGGNFLQTLMASRPDTGEKKVIVLDGTGKLYEPLVALAKLHNDGAVNQKTGQKTGPTIVLEKGAEGPVTDEMRLQLSDRVRRNELFAFVEIDANALTSDGIVAPDVKTNEKANDSIAEDESNETNTAVFSDRPSGKGRAGAPVRIYSEGMSRDEVGRWLRQSISQAATALRLEEAGLNTAVVLAAITPIGTEELGLYSRKADGEMRKGGSVDRGISFMMPFGLMMLMFMSVMIVCQPMISSVLEEKQQRIAEMLLGSANPFEIMAGKLLGNVGVALTIVGIYLTGGYLVAAYYGYADLLPMWLLGWFVVFEILACVLYGSLFLAVGAACNELKEAQSLLTPMMILLVMPMMVWFNVVQEPLGAFAEWTSLIPPATPMLMLMRLGASPMVPMWQPMLGMILVLATAVLAVFAGGRVFRIGLLMQGKAPKLTELVRWAMRG